MTPEIKLFIDEIATNVPGLASVWLIGSRANGNATSSSDWDFIAFGTSETLSYLTNEVRLHRAEVDFLVVTNGNDFQAAWSQPDKGGSLAEWEWNDCAPRAATYMQCKWRDAIDGAGFQHTLARAVQIWP